MAYAQANLAHVTSTQSGSWGIWVYQSADPIATVRAAGYISNATEMGLSVRDWVIVIDTATPTQQICTVVSITAGAADLTDGLVVPQTNT
jgi:hypothetical protein